MVTVEVCIGSACYVKGSNQIVTMLQELVKQNGWEEKVSIKGAFCMGMCTQGMGIKVNGSVLTGIGLHNAKAEIEQAIRCHLA